MYRAIVIAALSLLAVGSTALAGLTPTKPSQLADLTTDFLESCPLDSHAYALDRIQKSDGTTAPFTIPPKQVFVVTAAEISTTQVITSGHHYEARLFRELPNGNELSIVTITDAVAQANATIVVNLPNGSVVKSGVRLCVIVSDLDGTGAQSFPNVSVHGFFAKDN